MGHKAPDTKGEAARAGAEYLPPAQERACVNRDPRLPEEGKMKLRIAAASLLVALATAACASNPVAPSAQKDAPSAPVKDNGTGNWMGKRVLTP
jgi:hypothetical protein